MRYYLLVNRRPEGPFEAFELLARPDFTAESMVCPVGETSADAWRRAEQVPELCEPPSAQEAPALEAEPAAGLETVFAPEAEGGTEAAGFEGETLEPAAPEAIAAEAEPDPTAPPDGAEISDEPAVAEAAAAEPVAVEEVPLDAPAADDAPVPDDNPARRLIMVVDDDSDFRTILASAVKKEGFRTVSALDGKDATGKIQPFTPDLIITDLMMPRQGGYEFIRGLQSLGLGDIPVVVVTGVALDPSTVASMRMEDNIVEFFTKPLNMGVLLTLIHDKLGTKRLSPRQKLEKENDDGWSSAA